MVRRAEQDTMTLTLPSLSTNHSGAQARERFARGTAQSYRNVQLTRSELRAKPMVLLVSCQVCVV